VRGFTLIEIMVVLVVVGILVSLFTLSMGSLTEDEDREHMRRLEALLGLALEEASIQGREIGLRFYQHGYEFSAREWRENKDGSLEVYWAPLQDDLLRPRFTGDELSFDIELDGNQITLLFEADSEKAYRPHVEINSDGFVEPPFVALLRPAFSNRGVALSVTEDGTVEWVEDDF